MADEGKTGELLNWTRFELLMDFEPPNPSLIVEGELPHPMKVVLEPFPELLVEPEYWPTKVVGYSEGKVTQVVTPYSVQVPLSELSTGTKGIGLVGKDQGVDIDVPGSG
ncbi:MAG TPA: hypothetical protein VKH20_07205 [Solirubrobacterales bacterium]|nr:hypothetical protein [Solirubrobacterales bacterium]